MECLIWIFKLRHLMGKFRTYAGNVIWRKFEPMECLTWTFLSSEFACFVAGEVVQVIEAMPGSVVPLAMFHLTFQGIERYGQPIQIWNAYKTMVNASNPTADKYSTYSSYCPASYCLSLPMRIWVSRSGFSRAPFLYLFNPRQQQHHQSAFNCQKENKKNM